MSAWEIIPSKKFTKDLARMQMRGGDVVNAHEIIEHLRIHGQAAPSSRPHKLRGEWTGYWECHIGFDWLLVYTITPKKIILWRTGTHEDLFG